MSIRIHYFIFGEKNKGHNLIASTLEEDQVPRGLWSLTDRPTEIHSGETWFNLFACGPVEGGWAVWISFNDSRKRSGMVQTHVRFVPDNIIPHVHDLNAIFDSLPNELQNTLTVNTLEIPVTTRDALSPPIIQKNFISLLLQTSRQLPIVIPFEIDYKSIINFHWNRLWNEGRKAIAARSAFGPESFDIKDRDMLILTPLGNLPRWSTYPTLSLQHLETPPTLQVEKYFGGEAANDFSSFLELLEPKPSKVENFIKIDRAAMLYANMVKGVDNPAELVALTRLISFLAPLPTTSEKLKVELTTYLLKKIPTFDVNSILSMANLELLAFPGLQDQIAKEITNWISLHMIEGSKDKRQDLLKRATDSSHVSWWRNSTIIGIQKVISQKDNRTILNDVWDYICAKVEFAEDFLNIIMPNQDIEKLSLVCTNSLTTSQADSLLKIAVKRQTSSFHAALLVSAYNLVDSLDKQTQFIPEPMPGLDLIIQRRGAAEVIKSMNSQAPGKLYSRLAETIKTETHFLKEFDPSIKSWRRIWYILSQESFDVLPLIPDARKAVLAIFDLVSKGDLSEIEILSTVTDTPHGHLLDAPEYISSLSTLNAAVGSKFIRKTCSLWKEEFATRELKEDPHQDLKPLLQSSIIDPPSHLRKCRPNLLTSLLHIFPTIDENVFIKWFEWYLGIASLDSEEASLIAESLKNKSWSKLAKVAFDYWFHNGRKDIWPILDKLRGKLPIWFRVLVPKELSGSIKMTKPNPVSIFYSYCHKDEEDRNELEKHLTILRRQGLVSMWHDRKIQPGQEWKDEIDQNLESADVILLLISSDFINSDYCWSKELARALERHEAESAIVIPVILRDCLWQSASFGKIQGLPKDGHPVHGRFWKNVDEAFTDIAKGIEKVIKSLTSGT